MPQNRHLERFPLKGVNTGHSWPTWTMELLIPSFGLCKERVGKFAKKDNHQNSSEESLWRALSCALC